MEIAFGLFILGVLIAGLLYRRRQNKAWIQEERYDESGAWVDKRAGERGTYGSLDAEMEVERRNLRRQDQVNELSRLIRDYAIGHYPGFHELTDTRIKAYNTYTKTQITPFLNSIEQLLAGRTPRLATQQQSMTSHSQAVKKMMLDFSYRHYPALLDLEIDIIRQFDALAGSVAIVLVEKMKENSQ